MSLTATMLSSTHTKGMTFNECDAHSSISTCSGRSFSRGTSPTSTLIDESSRSASPAPSQINRSNHQGAPRINSDFLPAHGSSLSRAHAMGLGRRPLLPRSQDGFLAQAVGLGDILYVPGSGGGLAEIGTAGGFMGHFMVVVGQPERIIAGSDEAHELAAVWPKGAQEILQTPVLESTRGVAGLHEADLLMRVDSETNRFLIFGEIDTDGELSEMDDEFFELWQSPPNLRAGMRLELARQVVAEMKVCNGSWSIATAARALFLSANSFSSLDKAELLAEIRTCWSADPICTSVVIIFWQRYLCKNADSLRRFDEKADPSDLIMEYMPLKADRGLPGDVLKAMKGCGWKMLSQVPSRPSHGHAFRSTSCDLTGCQSAMADSRFTEGFNTYKVSFSGSSCSIGKQMPMTGFFECMESSLESIPVDSGVNEPHSSADMPLLGGFQPRSFARSEDESDTTNSVDDLCRRSSDGDVSTEEPVPSAPPRTQPVSSKHGRFSTIEDQTWGPVWL